MRCAWLVIAPAVLLSNLAGSARAEAPQCYSDWSQARAIVSREGLVTVDELVKHGPSKLGGEILRTILCQDGAVFTYRLVVRDSSGTIRQVVVDARRPLGP